MLNSKQKKFIPEYLKTGNVKATCKQLKIDESTYYKWRDGTDFTAELRKQEDKLYNQSLDKLRTALPDAIDTLKNLLKDDAASIRLRSACAIIDNTFKLVETKELKERVEILEKAALDK